MFRLGTGNLTPEEIEEQFTKSYDFEHVTFQPADGGQLLTFEWNEKYGGPPAPIACVWTPTNVTAYVIK